jgi:hypothetical protein
MTEGSSWQIYHNPTSGTTVLFKQPEWRYNCKKILKSSLSTYNTYIHTLFNSLSIGGFSVTDYIKYYAYTYITYLPDYLSLQPLWYYCTFLTMFVLVDHPVYFPCWRKPEPPEKTHDFRQSVDRLFSCTWVRSENRISLSHGGQIRHFRGTFLKATWKI